MIEQIEENTKFEASVVIPVYNAERYVTLAVKSALEQTEVKEVLLVEDGSPDNALQVCRELAEQDDRVRILRHPGGKNCGAGASRNLGIAQATKDYVSFLDADDYMLPGRFKVTKEVFHKYADADGVYEAVGVDFESQKQHDAWLSKGLPMITTTTHVIPPSELFFRQSPVGSSGYANTDGWTVKRSFLNRVGLFNPDLPLHQDTELFVRFALVGRMYAGEIVKPIAMRRVHSANRINRPRPESERLIHRIRMWCSLWRWAQQHGYHREANVMLERMALMTEPQSLLKRLRGLSNNYKYALKHCDDLSSMVLLRALLCGAFQSVASRLFR